MGSSKEEGVCDDDGDVLCFAIGGGGTKCGAATV
jgi:hypothetical protein